MATPSTAPANSTPLRPYFFADLYSFKWSEFSFRLPLISSIAVATCLFTGRMGHPGGGLIAGGGAFTVGFGANQRIADSRSIPMMAAILAVSASSLIGTVVGHETGWLVLVAVIPLVRNGWRLYGPAPELDRVAEDLAERRRQPPSHRP